MHDDIRHSRPLATAAKLGSDAKDTSRFLDKQVFLTGESRILSTKNGCDCFLTSLRLLIRISRHVTVYIPPELVELNTECRMVADHIRYDQKISFPNSVPDVTQFDAVLSVGTAARPDLPWTVINSNGWLARVSSGSADLVSDCGLPNPIGALAAACLGVTEVFKRLIQLRETRGRLLNGLTFSLYSYKTGDGNPGPVIPTESPGDLLVIGSGAIGNGVIYLLSRIGILGHVNIVDGQLFQSENLGTCMLIGPQDVDRPKAEVAEEFLADSGISVKGYSEDLDTFCNRLGKMSRYPEVVLNGLDNIEARHHVQDLWPEIVIDGAIGDFGCQVSVHPWGRDVACLRCLFRKEVTEAAESVASRATGLTTTRVQEPDELLNENDVSSAPSNKRAWLRQQVGRKICSIVQEAVVRELSIKEQRAGFQPSVPFVACLSACMVVGELVKYRMGINSTLEPRYQLDVLHGPERGLEVPQERRCDCLCVSRARNIELLRSSRVN